MKNSRNIKTVKLPAKVLVVIVILVIFTAVFWIFSLFRFPVKKYVKSALYAICYEETDEYKKLTNASDAEIKESIEEDLRYQAETYAAYFGIENLSDKSLEMLQDFSKDVYSYSKFKIKKVKKTKEGYTVTVKVKRIIFSKISKKNIDKYINEFNARAEDSEFLYDSDSIYEEKFVEGLIASYKDELENIEYGKYKKVKVTVSKTGNNRYAADLTEALNSMIEF